jgi:chorismate mutase
MTKDLNRNEELRKKIDELDTRMISLLKSRFLLVTEIGLIKKDLGLPVFQKSRWSKLLRDRIKLTQDDPTKEGKLKRLFVRDLFLLIHSESLDIQEKIRNGKLGKKIINTSKQNRAEHARNPIL